MKNLPGARGAACNPVLGGRTARPPALGAAQRGWARRPAGRDKSPENSPAATADRRPTA